MNAVRSWLLLPALWLMLSSCTDKGKASAERAAGYVKTLTDVVETDVGEVRRGTPEAAKRLADTVGKGDDLRANPTLLKRTLSRTRSEVKDLLVAKSTFFVLIDENGTALRNDIEPDTVAGKNLREKIPALSASLQGGVTETHGAFADLGRAQGTDRVWLFAAPVKNADGKTVSVLTTGWSYRLFARHLVETLKRDVFEAAKQDPGKAPLFYIGVFDETGVFMAPGSPQIHEDTLTPMNLAEKTAKGPFTDSRTIADRAFGIAAARTPAMGDNVGIVIVASEI
jgi:hypothetical protein